MGAVQWWDHSRVRLDEYGQSLKICKSILPAQQANKPTERNPVADQKIISRTKTSVRKIQKQKHYTISKKNKQKEHKNNIRKHTKKK